MVLETLRLLEGRRFTSESTWLRGASGHVDSVCLVSSMDSKAPRRGLDRTLRERNIFALTLDHKTERLSAVSRDQSKELFARRQCF